MKQHTLTLTTKVLASVLLWSTIAAVATGQDQVKPQGVPYDVEKFRSVLDDSKLQAPESTPTLIEQGGFPGASNQYFFLDPTGQYMTFTVSGDIKRSELRQQTGNWDTATKKPQRLIARVKVYVPEDKSLEQFTFLQIHAKKRGNKGLNKPLLRVTSRTNYRGQSDHIWAHIRIPKDFSKPISDQNIATKNVDFGPRPKGFFDIEVRVQNSRMLIGMAGKKVVDIDVAYWNGLSNYYKAGVYNQDPGRSKVEFESLRYANSEDR